MKTSPLTAEEIQGIQEGLKVFKLDWMSVWKFIVPHRDPSLLPRQWRIALGTQRSYKQDAAKKEKRRLYESERRKRKAADLTKWQHASDKEDREAEYTGVENCSGDDDIDNADESYVHEGFLADWRPGISKLISSERPCLNIRDKNLPNNMPTEEGACVRGQSNSCMTAVTQPLTGHMQGSPHALNNSQHPYTSSHCASNALQPTHPVPNMISNTSKSQICLWPYRSRKSNNLRLVKLAPDLPPVNLPPSVRVIPQSALKINKCGAYTMVPATGNGFPFSHSAKSSMNKSDKSNPTRENVTNSRSEESGVVKDKSIAEERSTHTDLQMHPLLFQAPEDGQVSYYPLNCGTDASSSFSFFSGNQPQLNLSLFYNPHQANYSVDRLRKSLKMKEPVSASCSIDFHPLLQRTDETNSEPVNACSTAAPSVSLDSKSAALSDSSNAVHMNAHHSPFAARSRLSSPNEKANELDLEIHLSSSTKENALLSRNVTAPPTNSSASLQNSQNATEMQDTFHSSGNEFVSGADASTISGKIIGRYNGDSSDQSHPEIVMEQEELSDSDEDVEECVEFECEEMADSEGEEDSGCEQVSEMQDKEAQGSTLREIVTDEDCNNQQCSHGTVCAPERRSPSFLKLGLTCPKKDPSRSWLSLDSSASSRSSRSKPKNEGSTMSKCPPTKTSASHRLNRPLKQATASSARKVTVQEHGIGMAEQLSLGPLSVPTLRKPRKRTCRANTTSNAAGTSLGNSRKDGKDSG